MTVVDRLEKLAEAGYTAGVGAVNEKGEPLSYRVTGYGVDLLIAVDEADAILDSLDETHAERKAEAEKTPEMIEAEVEAQIEASKVAEEKATVDAAKRLDRITAKIQATNLPAAAKDVLVELAQIRLGD